MQNLQDELVELLKNEENLVIDGQLNKNKIIELCLKVEPQLIRLLIQNEMFKKHFFEVVDEILVFDKIKFQRFVSNKSFLPDSYTSFKNKIGLVINDDYQDNFISKTNDVVLAFPYKDCVLEGGQTKDDQKRNEIFWNETLAPDNVDRLLDPKAFTNFKKYDAEGEHNVTEITEHDNLILKGNNLLVIASLLKTHRGKIKLIYIDPPYNTKGEADSFKYNNTFNHSTWLTFIKNRLEIARQLLREDGFLVISIDHYELGYLIVLCDELFGRENRLGVVSVVHKPEGRNQEKFFGTSNEFALFYAKNKANTNFQEVVLDEEKLKEFDLSDEQGRYKLNEYLRLGGGDDNLRISKPNFWYPIYVSKDLKTISLEKFIDSVEVFPITRSGKERTWKTKANTFQDALDNNQIVAKKIDDRYDIFEKYRPKQVIKTHWIDKKYNAINYGTKTVDNLIGKGLFSFPKSVYLIEDIIKLTVPSHNNSIVLDFFGGSGTTSNAVLNLNNEDNGNRKFILCEQMDYIKSVTVERVNRIIELNRTGNFVYAELMEYNQYFVNKIQEATTKEEILAIWEEMQEKAFISYQFDKEMFNENLDAFTTATLEMMQRYLIEVLDKNQLYVNYSEIDDETYNVSAEDKAINNSFYNKK